MDATMKELARSNGSFSAKLAIIDERASLINRVVGKMTKVANQTNLLSLNAALEAERAGKYGLGFRVVAQKTRGWPTKLPSPHSTSRAW